MNISDSFFGKTRKGEAVYIHNITNRCGMSISLIDFGATIQSIKIPRKGGIVDVCLGYDDLSGYEDGTEYIGSTIGRYANRISKAKFYLDGVEYMLSANEGLNQLHGGDGLNKRVFQYKQVDDSTVSFFTFSPNGERGFPGNVKITVTYRLSEMNEIEITYDAESDKDTILNLTNHSYFNLNGGGSILGHKIKFNSSAYTAIDRECIPTGEVRDITGTPFDFSEFKEIGRDIKKTDAQLSYGGGYDHNFILNTSGTDVLAASALSEETNIRLTVYTTMPGLQFYSGNSLSGTIGKGGNIYSKQTGFCLETQFYPDTPNHPEFPSCVLRPGDRYHHRTVYKFDSII